MNFSYSKTFYFSIINQDNMFIIFSTPLLQKLKICKYNLNTFDSTFLSIYCNLLFSKFQYARYKLYKIKQMRMGLIKKKKKMQSRKLI